MKKIVIASDSFKGSLSSKEVAQAAAEGFREALGEGVEIVEVQVADGGEGTSAALAEQLGGEMQTVVVCDPLFRPVEAHYAIVEADGKRTAVMEMAEASGLTLIPTWVRNPIATSTFGTGEMIKDAIGKGCTELLIGIGGSATNDAGTGMLTALGWRFLDKNGEELAGVGGNLDKIEKIDDSLVPEAVRRLHVRVACDVETPFFGPNGATRVFAPQKGADEETVEELEAGMQHFASLIGGDFASQPGTGAAGGLGGGLKVFLHAELISGAELVLDTIGFDQLLEETDLVITGEGKSDSQTLTGKTPYCVMQHARRRGIPTIGIAGRIEEKERLLEAGFADFLCINEGCELPLQELMCRKVAAENVKLCVRRIAERL